jgi:hypothetical protein
MQKSLKKFAHQLENNPLCRQGFFLAAALISIIIVGYHFGSFDQSVHIPFLKAWANPTLYPTDPFLALRRDQFSFFWYLFLPFLKAGILEPVLFLTHLFATMILFQAIWDLSMTLFAEPLAALFAVLIFIIPHTGFLGFPVIEFSLESRTFVLPFLLISVNHFLNKRYGLAFLILGLMYNFNLLMTNFVLVMLLICILIEIRQIGLRKAAYSFGLFLIGALPVLAWKIRSGTGIDLSLRPEWFSDVTRGVLFQVFYLFTDKPFFLLTLGGISCILLFFIAQKDNFSNTHNQQELRFMLVLIGIMILHLITTQWLPLTFIIQMQISRASLFILIFSYIYFAGYLAKNFVTEKITGGNFILIGGCMLLSLSPIIPLLAWIIAHKNPKFLLDKPLIANIIPVIILGFFSFATKSLNLWQPGIQVYARQSAWVDVQLWARENTNQNALFITPPQEVGIYQPDWRVFSERGTVASLYDLFEIALKPDYLRTWKPRFEILAPGALNQFNGNFFENQEITLRAFNLLYKNQFLKIACQYQATYLVTGKADSIDLPIIYENQEYIVFDLRNISVCR